MNLNFHGELNGITWQQRLCTVVWLVLTALALGENVLIHCRQGKHRSRALAMLMLGILAPAGLENYDSLEESYFKKNPNVTFSEWWEWWYNAHRERIMPDRWRLWNLWKDHGFEEQVQQFRRASWVRTILQHMQCPPARFNVFPSCPASSAGPERRRSRSRSPVDKPAGFYKRPEPTAKVRPTRTPRPPTSTPPTSTSSARSSSPAGPSTSRPVTLTPAAPSSSSTPRLRPTNKFASRKPAPPSSSAASCSSSAAHPASSVPDVPWPCTTCRKMPWRCCCQRPASSDVTEDELFKTACKAEGVWDKAEQDQAEADKREARDRSPVPDKESALWVCPRCRNMNTVHNNHCQVATCGERRPLLQKFRTDLGDWYCPECNNHNKGYRKVCNWSACETRDWWCSCGNLNRSNRKFCNKRNPPCGLPRPFDFD